MRTAAALGQGFGDLRGDQHFLQGGEQLVGLGQMQADQVDGQGVALEGEYLTDHGFGVVLGVHDDLHGDPHSRAPFVGCPVRARLTAVRSKQSTRLQYSSSGSSSTASPKTPRTVLSGGASSRSVVSSAMRTVVAHSECSWRRARKALGPPQSSGARSAPQLRTTETHVVKNHDAVAMRPLTLEEAVKEAEFKDREVFVFRDKEGRVRVLHRTKDGKMELIEAP